MVGLFEPVMLVNSGVYLFFACDFSSFSQAVKRNCWEAQKDGGSVFW